MEGYSDYHRAPSAWGLPVLNCPNVNKTSFFSESKKGLFGFFSFSASYLLHRFFENVLTLLSV